MTTRGLWSEMWNVVLHAETRCNVRAKTTYSGRIGNMHDRLEEWVGGIKEMHYYCVSL
jgi:hypothetical protein